MDGGRRLGNLCVHQLSRNPLQEGSAHLVFLTERSQAIGLDAGLEFLDDHFAEEHVVNLALQRLVVVRDGAREDEIDHEQEVLMAVLEHIVKLGRELSHSWLVEHKKLSQQCCNDHVYVELHRKYLGSLLRQLD